MDLFWVKGGRYVRLTTYHTRSAERQENPGLKPTRNPLGHLGLLWETFTFYLTITWADQWKPGNTSFRKTTAVIGIRIWYISKTTRISLSHTQKSQLRRFRK
jgi:hypothetical protein